jgi:hypothetical protein
MPSLSSASFRPVFRLVPQLVRTHALLGPRLQPDRVALEPEILVNLFRQFAETNAFVQNLAVAAENMRIILRKLPDTHQTVQRAVRLVPVATSEFGEAQRQIAVRLDPLLENLHMRRAVHGLQRQETLRLFLENFSALFRIRHHVGTTNMFSRYLPQWPDASQKRESISCGVFTSL